MKYSYTYSPSQLITGTFEGCDLGDQYYRINNVKKLNHLLTKAYELHQGVFVFELLGDDFNNDDFKSSLYDLRLSGSSYATLVTEHRVLVAIFTSKGEDFAIGIIDSITADYSLLLSANNLQDSELETVCFEVYQLGVHTKIKSTRYGKGMSASDYDNSFEGKKLVLVKKGEIVS